METVQLCKHCGAAIAEDLPEGLCPKCLVTAGLMSELSMAAKATVVVTASQLLSEPTTPPSIAAPEPPQQFGGYRIVRPLGKGGMGAVYEAEEIESGRRVALKVLSHSLDSPEARKRFLREGRLAASVNHPNSVYIYGTEEIDGTPVIAMELVSGGTLQARVKNQGPLPIREAVDATLQVIAGLEAAAAIGVLHRDVKPANCFVDADGTVKVGDFGLSISTIARGESNLTVSGAFLGTPAYSSPEQLRGEDLDLRSDIYAVGVTLYYLLTGKTPFAGEHMVQLLANVLERAPESPVKWRAEIPKDLANVVLRCLAKQPVQRFKTYDELRAALAPFTSTGAVPAPIGLRIFASVIDGIIFSVAAMPFIFPTSPGQLPTFGSPTFLWLMKMTVLWSTLYYAIPEGLFGASLGKAICRLRVMGLNGNTPGLLRALLRAAIFVVLSGAPQWLVPNRDLNLDPHQLNFWLHSVLGLLATVAPFFVLFCTARRKNGFAGLHDLASGTRVIRKQSVEARPASPFAAEAGAETEMLPQVGPYHLLGILNKTENHELLSGYDTRLLRKVWIRKVPLATPRLSPQRHSLGRPGRLRWLSGKRSESEAWDAYEATPGRPLLEQIRQAQPWRIVRHWLEDLVEESAAALKDHSLPERFGLDRVWIMASGRAKLLDFPAPGSGGSNHGIESHETSPTTHLQPGGTPSGIGAAEVPVFLRQVAASALMGRMVPLQESRTGIISAVLPVSAHTFLNELTNFSSLEHVASWLGSLRTQPAAISLRTRLFLFAGCSLPLIFTTLILVIMFPFFQKTFVQSFVTLGPFFSCMERVYALDQAPKSEATTQELRALEIYIATNFRPLATNNVIWPVQNKGSADQRIERARRRFEQILAANLAPSEKEVADATALVKPILDKDRAQAPVDFMSLKFLSIFFSYLTFGIISVLVALPSLIAAPLFRGGLLVHALGIAFVTRNGSRASRLRLLARSVVAWSPLALSVFLFVPGKSAEVGAIATVISLTLFAIGAVWSFATPAQGLQDRIAGVWLVPR